ncbi:MAG: hypothetical protein U1F77_16880 [Kiritimatiellia bacterium]
MRALIRKSLRDLWLDARPGPGHRVAMACGVATFTMSMSTRLSLAGRARPLLRHPRPGGIVCSVKRALEALAARIVDLPGVARWQTRVVVDVNSTSRASPTPSPAAWFPCRRTPRRGSTA